MNRRALVTAWFLSILLTVVAHAAAVRTVALSGQPAPGTATGVNYSSLSQRPD